MNATALLGITITIPLSRIVPLRHEFSVTCL